MDTEQRIELALRKQRLLMRSAELRGRFVEQVQPLVPLFAAADRVSAGLRWIKRHPVLPVVVLVATLVARPRAVLRWAQRGWLLWQMTGRLRDTIVGGTAHQVTKVRRWRNGA